MPRTQRIRIVAGLSAVFVGVILSIAGPAIAIALIPPLSPADVNDGLSLHIAAINRAGNTGNVFFVGGLGIAFFGLLFAFCEWARWYVTSPDNA